MKGLVAILMGAVALGAAVPTAAEPASVMVGVNIRGWGATPPATQDAKITELKTAGVTVIRESFPSVPNAGFNRFIATAYRSGIGTVAIIYPTLGGSEAHTSGVDPANGRRWRTSALSDANPDGFSKAFAAELAQLEDAGVKLAAFEIGNEFNTVGYNADLAAPSSGRILGLTDLENPNDAEAHAVATGLVQYVKILAAAKAVRDHSKLNRSTPIVAGGLANVGPAGPTSGNHQLAASVSDTIAFLRRHGADAGVAGYGVHVYSSGDPAQTIAQRTAVLQDVWRSCTTDRPCWLTEWAFNNRDQSCPLKDDVRTKLVGDERAALRPLIAQGRMVASLYYSWDGDFPGQKENAGALVRCGSLTRAGVLALSKF